MSRSFTARGSAEGGPTKGINNMIVTPCFISLAIRWVRTPHPSIGNPQDSRVSIHLFQSNLKFIKDLKIGCDLSCFVVTLTPKLLPKIEAELIKGFDKTIAIESVL